MYETFDHTADLGLRVRTADLNSLFAEAGLALQAALVEDLGAVVARERIVVTLPPDDLEYLLFDWLRALLQQFEVGGLLFSRFAVTIEDDGLRAEAWGEPMDFDRHEPAHEVKAITYHDLRVERTADGWLAEVIIDI